MIPIARPQLGPEEETAVLEVMRSGALAQGPRVRAFEEAWAAATGARFAVATSNGTTALYLALVAHGVGPGDEVITSALTFIATANAIAQTGARPVLADVDDSLNLDPRAVAGLIGPRTKAIVPVHLHGNPCDIASFMGLAQEHGLALIQDACQAVGATIAGAPLGTFGTAVYSLYATKNITTGEGPDMRQPAAPSLFDQAIRSRGDRVQLPNDRYAGRDRAGPAVTARPDHRATAQQRRLLRLPHHLLAVPSAARLA
jgi:dTDP-4-amino-4,6-dideoxygalactose transaminase